MRQGVDGYSRKSRYNTSERRLLMEQDRLLTVAEVADWIRVHPETVRLWLRQGALRGFMPGGKRTGYRVRESELQRFLAEREGVEHEPRPSGTEGNAAA